MPTNHIQSKNKANVELPQRPLNRTLSAVAAKFIEIHLDTPTKRDLLVWFMANPHRRVSLFELVDELGHPSQTLTDGLRALNEAGVILPMYADHFWQLTADPATRTIAQAAAQLVLAQAGPGA